jgi:hypothetical protein
MSIPIESTKQMRRRMSLLLACTLLLLAVATFTSFSRARSRAMSLAATGQLVPLDSRLSLYRVDTQRFSPAWEFRFDPPDMFIISPLVIQVGFGGNVQATRPPNLLELLTVK